MFFALQVDRGNLQQALADNLLDDLGMNTNGTWGYSWPDCVLRRRRC